MKKYLKILVSLPLLLGSCAPKVTERHFENPETAFGTDVKDVRLNLRLRELGEEPPNLEWKGTVSTAAYFTQAENLIRIGDENQRPNLREKGLSWIRRFYQAPGATPMADMGESPFINLAAAQVEPVVQGKLTEVLIQMKAALPVILKHVAGLGSKLPPPSSGGLEGLLAYAKSFTKIIIADIPKMQLPRVIGEGFKAELIQNTDPLFATLDSLVKDLRRAETLSKVIAVIKIAIDELKIKLSPQLARSIAQGESLGRALDKTQDAQGALTVIVDVWLVLTPQERIQEFKPTNLELYNFLYRQSSSSLECLRSRGCYGNPVDGAIKKFFVFPKIEKYGVGRLKREINQKTLDYVSASIESFVREFVIKMPKTFAEEIEIAWHAKEGRIANVHADFQGYLNRAAGSWAKEILPTTNGKVPGFEASYAKIAASRQADLRIEPLPQSLELSGDVAGSSLTANVYLMQNAPPKDELAFRSALSQINKIIAFGGYRNTRDQLVPALLAPVGHRGTFLDIAKFETAKTPIFSYRVPDRIALQNPFLASPEMNYQRDFSASGFSMQIKGLSQSLLFTADWKKTSFERLLGSIQAQDLTKDAKDPSLLQPLFPKDKLFALNVGTVSVLLQDLKKKMTPVFLLTLDHKMLWADQYLADSLETPIMAGIVDIKNGKKSDYVEAREVAKFILALGEFIEALNGVENTQSTILLKKNSKGTRPLDSLISGRQDIKNLSVALANFLAKKMRTSQSLVKYANDLTSQTAGEDGVIRVETQAYVISALVKIYEISQIESYLWSAQSIYYAMNRNLYSVKSEFYVDSDGTELDFAAKVTTLRALSELKPYLPDESRQQLQKLMTPWLEALTLLR